MFINEQETARTRTRYQRIAPLYDVMEFLAERHYTAWRPHLWSQVKGPKVLEVGVGTGKNIPYYPADLDIIAIDLTPGMLDRARTLAAKTEADVELQLGDVQKLDFPDNLCDEVVSAVVFCSVPDPVVGFNEVGSVLNPDGRWLLLEHVRSANPMMGALMDLLDPVMVRLMGSHINRRTVANIQQSQLQVEQVENIGAGGIFKLIVARKV